MTDEVELRQALQRIREEASAARSFFRTWNALNMARGETGLRATMNDYRYVDFFITSMEGNFRLLFLSLRKIFDRDKYNDRDTIGFPFLAKKLGNYSPGFVVRWLGAACLAPILPRRAGSAAS